MSYYRQMDDVIRILGRKYLRMNFLTVNKNSPKERDSPQVIKNIICVISREWKTLTISELTGSDWQKPRREKNFWWCFVKDRYLRETEILVITAKDGICQPRYLSVSTGSLSHCAVQRGNAKENRSRKILQLLRQTNTLGMCCSLSRRQYPCSVTAFANTLRVTLSPWNI